MNCCVVKYGTQCSFGGASAWASIYLNDEGVLECTVYADSDDEKNRSKVVGFAEAIYGTKSLVNEHVCFLPGPLPEAELRRAAANRKPDVPFAQAKAFLAKHMQENDLKRLLNRIPAEGVRDFMIDVANDLRQEILEASDSCEESITYQYNIPSKAKTCEGIWEEINFFREKIKKLKF